MAKIIAVCVSEQKGTHKHEVSQIIMLPEHGIVGDAHAGNWHRQVSLLGLESVEKAQSGIDIVLSPGAFAENILTQGICLYQLPVGSKLLIGTATAQVTQIGKQCHNDCEIRRLTGDCIMPREGIFVKILTEGTAKPGDDILVI